MKKICETIAQLFILWVILAAVAAFFAPQGFTWFQPAIIPTLGVVMFGMGITLTPADFLRVWQQPKAVAVGIVAQFLIMPALGAVLAKIFGLAAALSAGVILVGSCPGGTASNVITYLAKADVALAVTLTAVSTVLGVVATPLLTKLYAGQYVAVEALPMLFTVARIVLLPVASGLLVRQIFKQRLAPFLTLMPAVSVLGIVLIVACIVGLSHNSLITVGPILFLVVVLHHAGGAVSGYFCARLLGLNPIQARTIAIEVATHDSGLGVALARKHFADVLVALPSALYSIWQNLAGPALATFWSRRPVTEINKLAPVASAQL